MAFRPGRIKNPSYGFCPVFVSKGYLPGSVFAFSFLSHFLSVPERTGEAVMRKSINANVNVIRFGIRRNRVEAVAASGVEGLRASGPAMHQYLPHEGPLGLECLRGDLRLLDSRSSLDASSAWPRLSLETSKREASPRFVKSCFTTTATATTRRPQAPGRRQQQRGIAAARLLASA
jgi:hypothetical protein